MKVEATGTVHEVSAILTVLPEDGATTIAMHSRNEDAEFLKVYFGQRSSSMAIINMVESWMLFGTDHWFLKPSEWNRIDEPRRQEICRLVNSDQFDISREADISVLDHMRIILIDSARENVNAGIDKDHFTDLIAHESSKLATA